MAQFSQNTSEQVIKSGDQGSGLPWRLLIFSVFIFFLVILIYAGMRFGYSGYLNSRIASQEEVIEALTQKVTPEARSVFVDFYSRLFNFKNLLNSHIYVSKIFPMIERVTSPNIYYNNLDLDITNKRLVLTGAASTFDALSRQLYLYDQEQFITGYILNQSRVVEGLINFKISLNLSDKLFEK